MVTFFFYFLTDAHAQSLSKGEPMFISRSETFKFVAGETIQLPCEVSNTGELNCLHIFSGTPQSHLQVKQSWKD